MRKVITLLPLVPSFALYPDVLAGRGDIYLTKHSRPANQLMHLFGKSTSVSLSRSSQHKDYAYPGISYPSLVISGASLSIEYTDCLFLSLRGMFFIAC
ncbi:hypothetical protein BDV97DRAFT_168752 [Delphinella strobiligena]|nr:hypothetical protein BDV97DRAFT_168752 [Delphinella strobiligena]